MSDLLLRINGDTRCPGGINVPKHPDDWEPGVFSAKLVRSAPSTFADGTKGSAPAVGDRIYVWVIESGKNSHGRGLTAIADVDDVGEDSDGYRLATSNIQLLSNPLSFDRAFAHAPGAKILNALNKYRLERIWRVTEDDREVLEELIAYTGGIQGSYHKDPIAEALERKKDEIEGELQQRKQAWIKPRPEQAEFRKQSVERHSGRCVFTGNGVKEALEAAHVIPHTGAAEFERPENNLLLRRDIHALFDLFLISIDADSGKIVISPDLNGSPYEDLRGKAVDHKLATSALEFHYQKFCEMIST